MLNFFGDVANWLAAGIMFPLMLLPVASLASGKRANSSLLWATLVSVLVIAGALFAALAPILRVMPTPKQISIFFVLLAGLGALIFASGGPERLTQQLIGPLTTVVRTVGRIVMWFLLLMALVQFGIVILRYVFGVNYIFMQESITYMHAAVFLLAGGYALLTNDHVRVDIFYRDASAKRKALVDFLGAYFLLFPICLLLLWTASPYVASSWAVNEGSTETSGIQGVFILKSLIPAFAVLLAMAGFTVAVRAGGILREGR
ncbi:MAG: hypothetical protein DHS20C05_11050 [Hyphococcus sp.]|nr:MAG: hypothetical protein DHS20C05_11050 [Marinicaulis sp.]